MPISAKHGVAVGHEYACLEGLRYLFAPELTIDLHKVIFIVMCVCLADVTLISDLVKKDATTHFLLLNSHPWMKLYGVAHQHGTSIIMIVIVCTANTKRYHNVRIWLYVGLVATQHRLNLTMMFAMSFRKVMLKPTIGKRCCNV